MFSGADKFEFVFTQLDALQAVAEMNRRMDFALAFGYPNASVQDRGYSSAAMSQLGWRYDKLTDYWFPYWWPEWSK